jgi:nucleoside-diphosphate-sugar epimerase
MGGVLFIGGPGTISSSCAEALLREGIPVSIFTRSLRRDDEGVAGRCRVFLGDRTDREALAAAIDSARPDAVADFCCFKPDELNLLLPLLPDALKQYVFVSTVDVYGYPLSHLPMREDDPKRAPNCRYAADKRACEQLLAQSPLAPKVTVFRPSYSMGKRFAITALSRTGGQTLVPRLRQGLPVLSPDGGKKLLHVCNARDTGRMVARTVLNPASLGKAYNGCAPKAVTYDEYIGLFAKALGVEPNIVHATTDQIYALADYRIFEENLLYDLACHDIWFSTENFLADFPDFEWLHPVEEAVRAYIDFQEARGGFASDTDPVETSVLRKLGY